MIKSSDYYEKTTASCLEAVDALLKRPWDPLVAIPSRGKLVSLQLIVILIVFLVTQSS